MSTDLIRYDLMVQEALRGVVRKVIGDAARDGLPGDHFFHISFRTKARGVRLSDRMRERYPDTMPIVLQHQFWDLAVTDEAFEVGLSFGGIPERVRVPFAAITEFFDETVQFGLRFELASAEPGQTAPEAAPEPAARDRAKPAADKPAPKSVPGASTKPTAAQPQQKGVTTLPHPLRSPPKAADGEEAGAKGAEEAKPAGQGEESGKVLSIDAFRKKT